MNLAIPGILQSLTDFISPLPKPYDPHTIKGVVPDPKKERTLTDHIRECHARYIEIRVELQDQRIEQARTQRLIWALIGITVAGNTETLRAIATFIAN